MWIKTINWHSKYLFYILFCLLVIWQLVGIFPLISYEADAVSICAGCEYSFRHGFDTLGEKGYGFWMQPLVYYLLYLLKLIFKSVSIENIYSIVSSISTIGLQYLIVLFVSHYADLNKIVVLAALFLVPETYALAMYPNTASISLLLYCGGLCMIFEKKFIQSVIILSIAPFFRLDILIIYPMLFFVLRKIGIEYPKIIKILALYAISLFVLIVIGYHLIGGDILFTIREFGRYSEIILPKKNLLAIYGFYGCVAPILIIIGLFVIIKKKYFNLLYITIAALILVHTVEFKFGNASKHFVYLLPFIIFSVAYGFKQILQKSVYRPLIIVLICIPLFCGIRVNNYENHIIPQTKLDRFIPTICKIDISRYHISFVIGGGVSATTSDEVILSSGYFFYPMFIHNIKEDDIKRTGSIIKYLKGFHNKKIMYIMWEEDSRFQLLQEMKLINLQNVYWDKELSFMTSKIEDKGEREEMIKYFYDNYKKNDSEWIFVATEAICHRWLTLLDILESENIIKRYDDGGIYRINK